MFKYIFWTAAGLMIFFKNDAVIGDEFGYLAMVMWLLTGCYIFNDK